MAFYGETKRDGSIRRTKADEEVISAWREHHRHLNRPPEPGANPVTISQWAAQGSELILNLLEKMAISTRYRFDRDQLRSGQYSPKAHFDREIQEQDARRLVLEVLNGSRPLLVRSATI